MLCHLMVMHAMRVSRYCVVLWLLATALKVKVKVKVIRPEAWIKDPPQFNDSAAPGVPSYCVA